MEKKKTLGLFQLVMINVIAVDSIRTLSFSAVYGFSLVFFYCLISLAFFIPTALVSAELGTGWPNRGGIYVWAREAFGKKLSLVVIWLNWIYNVIWYPTIMALIVGTFSYFFNADLANNKIYIYLATVGLFWAVTVLNCFGMKVSSALSTVGALLGTLFPMLLIIFLGILWVVQKQPMQIAFTWKEFFPHSAQADNLAFLTNVLFGLLGLEMSATHAAEMRNPQKDYPRSLWISVVIILLTIVCASLAIALVVPQHELSLATGVMQAFTSFAAAQGLSWLPHLIAACIILGGLSSVGAWVIGPPKGLLVASEDKSLPAFFTRTNQADVPVRILILQACIVSLLSFVFIFMPTINSSYWILSVITAQLALIVYIILFAAGLKLHYKHPHVKRTFRMPGNTWGAWLICAGGGLTALAVILIGFMPPSMIPFADTFTYECILIGAIVLCCVIPLFFRQRK